MKNHIPVSLLLCAFLALPGCGNQPPGAKPSPALVEQEKGNVSKLMDNDPEVNRAIMKARATAPEFVRALTHKRPAQVGFVVCKRFVGANGVKEDLWLTDLTFDRHLLHGKIDNIPDYVKEVHYRDAATVAPGDVIDWKYLDHGKMIGGYTIRAFYFEASPAEKLQMLKSGHHTVADMVRNF